MPTAEFVPADTGGQNFCGKTVGNSDRFSAAPPSKTKVRRVKPNGRRTPIRADAWLTIVSVHARRESFWPKERP
jgi:hypothetical protein